MQSNLCFKKTLCLVEIGLWGKREQLEIKDDDLG